MADGVNDPHQEALGELALAGLALDEHDLDHAVSHLSVALAHEPGLPEAHELLAKLAARSDDGGLALFRPGERAPVGRVVAFAHVLARHGGYADALSLLAQATVHNPGRPWADVSWVQALDPRLVPADRLVRVLLAVLGALPDPAPAPIAAATRPYLALAERALAAYPQDALLHGAASGVARRLREVPLALRWAQRGVELESTKLTEMWWGNALRADGQLAAAVRAMRAAQRHDPDDLSVTSDLALWLTELGHTAEALDLIEQALVKDPSYDCAVHTAHRLRFQSDGDPDHLVALADFMRATTDASHEHHDLQHCCDGLPWLGYVPAAVEVCVKVLRTTTDEQRAHPGEMGLSRMESPSALALLRRAWPGVAVAASEPGLPDPRVALRPGIRLWDFDGTRPSPALEPPTPPAAREIAAMLPLGWAPPPMAYDMAVRLSGVPVDELLAALVHPPTPAVETDPDRVSVPERQLQVWACLGLLHHRTGEPWATSTRRRLLVEIAFGAEDWTTEAALYALVTAAWVDPSCRTDVAELVAARLRALLDAGRTRAITIGASVAQLAFITPGMPAAVRTLARELAQGQWPASATYTPGPAAPLPRPRRSWLDRLLGRG
ncbi:tetratricopeptide repeat protein [Catellatospora citrea]|uniref:tetratricopeptide repeat protein n=1 Tax=Catellatospora citrea TaxID=53366 RepID=UPI0033DA48AE